MKLKKNFVLREIAGNNVILPLGAATVDFNGMMRLNDSGVLLWRALEKGADRETLAEVLLAEYEVERDVALRDVDSFINKMIEAGCIDA